MAVGTSVKQVTDYAYTASITRVRTSALLLSGTVGGGDVKHSSAQERRYAANEYEYMDYIQAVGSVCEGDERSDIFVNDLDTPPDPRCESSD